MSITLNTFFPLCLTDEGVSHTCLSLCEHMACDALDVRVWAPASRKSARRGFTRDAIPTWLQAVAYRLARSDARLTAFAEKKFAASIRPGDAAYIWPGTTDGFAARLKHSVRTVITERINCHSGTAIRIMERVYADLGWPLRSALSADAPARETEELAACDYVFSPSPFVTASLVEFGTHPSKIIRTSYGWNPHRLGNSSRAIPAADGCTFVFVGRLCVRKGVPTLLRAWRRAKLKGRLVLAGSIAPDVAEGCASDLTAAGVIHLPFTSNVGSIYRSGDVFVFPSHEEGSPLVMYEAMGVGLPSLISPIAAGAIVRDGVEGLHVDPNDVDAIADRMNVLAGNPDLRREMGTKARAQALEYTWQKVAVRRREQLLALPEFGHGTTAMKMCHTDTTLSAIR